MDLWTAAALLMLVVWGWATWALGSPGWANALLTAGVFVLIWRIVVRGTPAPRDPDAPDARTPRSDRR